ncbi:CHASE3 domain-containing protein [Rhodococcus koreensis]|uniref:CHASE3 domain-containing protein n=1 Tax=Rhodococcus koreensis TaxID=99653 RepID=UPI00366E33B2
MQEVNVARDVRRLLIDMETGQRGFIITGEPSFLEPWEIGRRTLPERVATLRNIVDDPQQAKRAEQMETDSLAYIRDYSVPLVDAARRGEGWVRGIPASEDGKRRIDSLRRQLDGYVTTEFALSTAEQADADNDYRRATVIAAGGLAASVLMTVLLSIYLTRRVVRPVRRTAMTAERIAAGKLDARVPETSKAEVGVLERAFNSMAESLQHHVGELARLSDEHAALRRVATLVARGRPSDEVFAAVAQEVGLVLGAEITRILRFEADGTATVTATWLRAGERVPTGTRIPITNTVAAPVRETGKPARITEESPPELPGSAYSAVGAPIIVGGSVWGAMTALSRADRPLPDVAAARIAEFTDLVGTAVANAQARADLVASRARIVAASDEARRRIERNLHDGAQQRLVALGLQTRLAEASVPPEQPPLRKQLGDIVSGLNGVSADLQEISRGIHPAILSHGGLGPALRILARRSAVPVDLDLGVDRRLPDSVEVGAYYVVSEALTNAAKHARASAVKVGVEAKGANLHLSIRDDGIGGADAAKGSGLIGLTDRVEALGGTMAMSSPPGSGTSLLVTIPLEIQ